MPPARSSTRDEVTARAALDRWWEDSPSEIYWLEVSERGDDLGVDLNAPSTNEVGGRFWSYDLVHEVREGDVVLHYDRGTHEILAWSRAIGASWPDTVVWAARGTFARGQNISPHERPGFRLSLDGPYYLDHSVTLTAIRNEHDRLASLRGGRPYFPFELGNRPTRPLQGYLFKLPAPFLDLFEALDQVPRGREPAPGANASRSRPGVSTGLQRTDHAAARRDFTPGNEQIRSRTAEPWSRDPSEVDRALSSHARVERLVAEAAAAAGWRAKRSSPADPPFDLILVPSTSRQPEVIVEVKSTTKVNEEKQLRLAVGQVLRYRQILAAEERSLVAMIAVEHEPVDPAWLGLCRSAQIILAWPETLREELACLS